MMVAPFACWSVVASLLLASPPAAQFEPPPAVAVCDVHAHRLARFAARRYDWSTRRPQARPVGTLGRGVVWHVYDSPACCGTGSCGTSSERDDGLVGVVGGRLFALTADEPQSNLVPAGNNRMVRPWRPREWTRFLRAADALPRSAEQAVSIAWLVYVSGHPEQGLVNARLADLSVMQHRETLFAELVAHAEAYFGEPIRSRAERDRGGFNVVLFTSRHVWFPHIRTTPSGLGGDEDLRRVRVRISVRGLFEFLEDVPLRSSVHIRR